MLPAQNRLRRRADFRAAMRHGRRAGRRVISVHMLDAAAPAPRVGFIVGRKVGGAVVRNRVKRRLRHLMQARLDRLPTGSLVVIRALPDVSSATPEELGGELDAVLDRLVSSGAGEDSGKRAPTGGMAPR